MTLDRVIGVAISALAIIAAGIVLCLLARPQRTKTADAALARQADVMAAATEYIAEPSIANYARLCDAVAAYEAGAR